MAAQQIFATARYHRNNAHQRNRGSRKPDRKANPTPKQLPSRAQRASFLHGLTRSQRQPVGTDGVASDGIWYRLSAGLKFHTWLMALTSDAKKADLFPHETFACRAANFLLQQVACGVFWQSARAWRTQLRHASKNNGAACLAMSQARTCVPLRRLLLLRSWTVREPRRLQKMRRMRGRKRDVLWTRSARQNDRRAWRCHHSTQLRCQLLHPSIHSQHPLRHTIEARFGETRMSQIRFLL